ncbi:MAG: hypothetical protein F4Y58_00910 [Gammaproteobacteria bacterium]|nr:hypothetical protein [Gammaproteobacteria bacterium]
MPTLTTNDFKNVIHKNGTVFYNQKKRRLDTRGGNFLSRLVTWIKHKYNPGKVNGEHKAAADSFISAVKHAHSEICKKHNDEYKLSDDDFNRLYPIAEGEGTPLQTRQVRQVLARLDTIPESLKIARDYASAASCRQMLSDEISATPDLEYLNDADIAKLGSRIKEAIMNKSYQTEGWITSDTAASIARQTIKENVGELKEVIENRRKAAEVIENKRKEVIENRRKAVEVIENRWMAVIENRQKEMAENRRKAMIEDIQKLSDGGRPIMTSRQAQEIFDEKMLKKSDATEPAKDITAQPQKSDTAEPAEDKTAQPQKSDAQLYLAIMERQKIKIPANLKEQVESGQINSEAELIKASNELLAEEITQTPIHKWCAEAEQEAIADFPEFLTEAILNNVGDYIKSSPAAMNARQALEYATAQLTSVSNEYLAERLSSPSIQQHFAESEPTVAKRLPPSVYEAILTKVKEHIKSMPTIVAQKQAYEYLKKALVQAANKKTTQQLKTYTIDLWYEQMYKEIKGEEPSRIPDEVSDAVRDHIESSPFVVADEQIETCAKQAITEYIKNPR